jgi:hypothetical protein
VKHRLVDETDLQRNFHRLSGDLERSLSVPLQQDLLRRIGKFLNGTGRGNLRLPRRFPENVRQLTKLSRTKLVAVAFRWKPDSGSTHYLSDNVSNFCKQAMPGQIWTRSKSNLPSTKSQNVVRLTRKHAPGGARAVWPSTPDIFEMSAMTRLGKSRPSHKYVKLEIKDHLTRQQVSNNIRLATRIVRQFIIGIRSSIEVPAEFRPYFRSRHDFLILSTRYNLPAGLVRFLLGWWVRCPISLWLITPCTFKKFLKRHHISQFLRGVPCQACALRTGAPDVGVWARPYTNAPDPRSRTFVLHGLIHVSHESEPQHCHRQ